MYGGVSGALLGSPAPASEHYSTDFCTSGVLGVIKVCGYIGEGPQSQCYASYNTVYAGVSVYLVEKFVLTVGGVETPNQVG